MRWPFEGPLTPAATTPDPAGGEGDLGVVSAPLDVFFKLVSEEVVVVFAVDGRKIDD